MEAISSADADVSSSEAACWEAPGASDWLEHETIDAAAETLSALSLIRPDRSLRAAPARRTIHSTPGPIPKEISSSTIIPKLLRAGLAEEMAESDARSRVCCSTSDTA